MAAKKRKYPELRALKGRIREKGTSYRKIASKLGMAVNTFSCKINGFYPINGDEMEKIATILDIPPAEIASFFMPEYCKTQHRTAQW